MSVSMRATVAGVLPELRVESTSKRIRAVADGAVVADSTHALLVWEPRRVVPSWAVQATDLRATLRAARSGAAATEDGGHPVPDLSHRPVLDPSVPFSAHTADGAAFDLVTAARTLLEAAFRPIDPDLSGYVVLDFAAFDEWWEEDTRNVAHPRDPYHRIDALPSSRHVRIELDGVVLAESDRPVLLFETMIPTTRFYVPRRDVRVPLRPSATETTCAYKGTASYFGATVAGHDVEDIAWSYEDPLPEGAPVKDFIAFFDEQVDVFIDGRALPRPRTPWSR